MTSARPPRAICISAGQRPLHVFKCFARLEMSETLRGLAVSKGLGKTERAVMDALASRTLTMYGIMLAIFGPAQPPLGALGLWDDTPPTAATEAQKVSVRRAVRNLERKGLVEVHDSRDIPGFGSLHRKSVRAVKAPS